MPDTNGNVKWVHMIPIIAITVTIGLFLGGGVIANDRLRASEDQRIEGRIDSIKDCYHKIDVRLARIEDRLGVVKISSNDNR